ncbi:hypothetical protein IAI53_13910 [Thauera sp. CAU 1555]|uniref:Uncharacterized protein n=1 Tax=Thauera sedimentorum TaxID=2767595 RepID=A0ABR9BCD2_9RHOO|nr:hypothetical protein [Thauera sedimentorum]MBC9073067.1 hypothetical protein [Thauera sedimentorum]MBD8503986.1 hypothetical protein [Thauera sedimentorum]
MTKAAISPSAGRLMSVAEAAERIAAGAWLWIAGDEALLHRLPRGHWIGGTIPYFMGQDGGQTSREQLFVTEVEVHGAPPQIRFHDLTSLARLCAEAPEHGYSFLIIPAFSAVHSYYARNAPGFEDMFVKPVVGWVAGVHLDELSDATPGVIDGETGVFDSERALVMHVPLPADRYARVEIVNLLEQGDGDRIRFPETGFSAGECLINGQPARLADYLAARDIDLSLPLVADYCGAMVNVSFKGVDKANGRVDFYAPVFGDVEYRLARRRVDGTGHAGAEGAAFSCNCILNYLYDRLEGRRTGAFTGPMTFGEIAYLLLNQTLVYLAIERT